MKYIFSSSKELKEVKESRVDRIKKQMDPIDFIILVHELKKELREELKKNKK